MTDPTDRWAMALRAVEVLASGARDLGGLWLRARPGPARDAFLHHLARHIECRRIHPQTPEAALFGGPDIVESLSRGRLVHRAGIVEQGGVLLLSMAERCPPSLATRLGQAIDAGRVSVIAVDEGDGPDEGLPAALADRLALFAALDEVRHGALRPPDPAPSCSTRPRMPADRAAQIATLAAGLGIDSLRAPSLALRTARALAGIDGAEEVSEAHLSQAAALTLAHRAAPVPEAGDAPQDADPQADPSERETHSETDGGDGALPRDLPIDAVRAVLPPELLAELPHAAKSASRGAGAGMRIKGKRRGRPLPPRAEARDGGGIDLVASLSAAAPWQKLRPGHEGRISVWPSDLRHRRYESRSDRLVVFVVDASGSAAMARLAETKGAIELMLGNAYASRDHVALIAFRGDAAETLLEPTRSLTRAKRRIGALPGGGGTPLAAGLDRARETCRAASARGFDARIALLTDGRANIARDGQAGRAEARADAQHAARLIRAAGISGVVLDAGRRRNGDLADLAAAMAMPYHFLPIADAAHLSDAAHAALDA